MPKKLNNNNVIKLVKIIFFNEMPVQEYQPITSGV